MGLTVDITTLVARDSAASFRIFLLSLFLLSASTSSLRRSNSFHLFFFYNFFSSSFSDAYFYSSSFYFSITRRDLLMGGSGVGDGGSKKSIRVGRWYTGRSGRFIMSSFTYVALETTRFHSSPRQVR